MGRSVVHHNDHVACFMVPQELIQEVNHLRRCNPLVMQDEQQASLRIDGGQRGYATAFPVTFSLGVFPRGAHVLARKAVSETLHSS